MSPKSHQPDCANAAHVVSRATELIEVLWGSGRDVSAPPVSPSQLKVMYALEDDDGINLRTLTERLGSTAPSVSRLCDRLQAVGFLRRASSSSSRRELQLWLSDRGRSFLRDLRARREAELSEVLADMPAAKRAALVEGLEAFRTAAAGRSSNGGRTCGGPDVRSA